MPRLTSTQRALVLMALPHLRYGIEASHAEAVIVVEHEEELASGPEARGSHPVLTYWRRRRDRLGGYLDALHKLQGQLREPATERALAGVERDLLGG